MIVVEDVTRNYGDFTAVDRVSFEIGRGEIVGLLGHNGAGKTTIMKMLTGYLEPSSGTIEIDGLDIGRDRMAIQRKIGYLPENCPVYPEMPVIEYLDYSAALHGVPQDQRTERVREVIAKTELASKAAQPIDTLSRGFRQRVGVAQALLHQPDILILDEPTNGLDPSQVQHMRELITEAARHATVILSTHILQEVQAVCDRVLIIRAGRKVVDERMEALRAAHRLLITVDAEPERVQAALQDVMAVDALEHLGDEGEYRNYPLALKGDDNPRHSDPEVAQALLRNGCQLYGLQTEQRSLESVFIETAAQ